MPEELQPSQTKNAGKGKLAAGDFGGVTGDFFLCTLLRSDLHPQNRGSHPVRGRILTENRFCQKFFDSGRSKSREELAHAEIINASL